MPDTELLALYFTPDAIRQHFEDDESAVASAVAHASDEQLAEVGEAALTADTLYREFHRLLTELSIEILEVKEENA